MASNAQQPAKHGKRDAVGNACTHWQHKTKSGCEVAFHLQENLLDLGPRQLRRCEVQALLVSLGGLIGATLLGQDAALNLIPDGIGELH